MGKKYAPKIPDIRLHRPKDTSYLRELLEAAGLSQRGAGPVIGMGERTMRHKAAGDQELSYPEQFILEVLADSNSRGDNMSAVQERAARYEAIPQTQTQWYKVADRPLVRGDAGKIIVGRDRYGAAVYGTLQLDGFGLSIKAADNVGMHQTLVANVALYTLLDAPSQDDMPPIETGFQTRVKS
jgi:hypothetical protein